MGTTTVSLVFLLAVTGLNPPEMVATDRVDVIEVNHFYDEQGKLVFDQLLYYDWSPQNSRYDLRAWRLLKTPAQIPQRDATRNDYVATFFDGQTLRQVRAGSIRESWTQYDPELVERELLPKEKRKELGSIAQSRKQVKELLISVRKTP